MNRKLGRYCKRVIAFISAFVVFFAGIYLTSFRSEAYGISESNTFYVDYPEPDATDGSGYFCVMYKSNDSYYLNTYFWNIQPSYADSGNLDSCYMHVDISVDNITFTPYGGESGEFFEWSLCEFGSRDTLAIHKKGIYKNGDNNSFSYHYSNPVVGYLFKGNVSAVYSSLGSVEVPEIHWTYSVDSSRLYSYMQSIINELGSVNANAEDISNKLTVIYNTNFSALQKLEQLYDLLSTELSDVNDELDNIRDEIGELLEEQKKSNSWLEKIYNKIVEALGLQGEESTEALPDEDVNSVIEEEDKLMQDTTEAENSLDFSVDSNSNNVVWNVIERVLNANPRVFGAFIGIMTLGVITLLLNR